MVKVPSDKDALVNQFLTLYVVEKASKCGVVDGRVKLMKLLYKVEEELTKRNIRGPSFVFYKWNYGPWSPEAQIDLELLGQNGLVTEDKQVHRIEPTSQGLSLVQSSDHIIKRNRDIFDVMDRVVSSNVDYKSWQLRSETYGTPLLGKDKILIEKVEKGEVVLSPVEEQRAFKFFLVDDDWLDMIATSMSEDFHKLVEQVLEKPNLNDYVPMTLYRKEHGLK
jgi:uncharacterized protein YwgA